MILITGDAWVDNFQDDHLIIREAALSVVRTVSQREFERGKVLLATELTDVLNYIVEVRNNRIAIAGDSPQIAREVLVLANTILEEREAVRLARIAEENKKYQSAKIARVTAEAKELGYKLVKENN